MEDKNKYSSIHDDRVIAKTKTALEGRGVEVFIAENKGEALEKIKELIPREVSVMNGSSKTLEEVGYIDYLKSGNHGWNNLHAAIVAEQDKVKQANLRKQALLADYYLGSVHALVENGEFVVASNTGSQLPHIVFSSPNLILVVGTQKIVPTLQEAMERLEKYVVPLEDESLRKKFGVGTQLNKIVIFKGENQRLGRKVRMILVKEKLGF